ncbi:MAG: hypothetical protein H7288_24270 [Kineosporiaceae bacterium]|nr:hypothetical protein [Aeromicrobium sp.]
MTPRKQTKTRLGMWLPSVAIVVISWLIFWMAQGFPMACNLVSPCPSPDVRVAPALLYGGMMLAPLIAVILMSLVRSPVGWLVRLSYVALVVLAVVGYAVINFSGGYGVDAPFLAGLLGICGTAVLAYLGIAALRRETSAAPLFSSK